MMINKDHTLAQTRFDPFAIKAFGTHCLPTRRITTFYWQVGGMVWLGIW